MKWYRKKACFRIRSAYSCKCFTLEILTFNLGLGLDLPIALEFELSSWWSIRVTTVFINIRGKCLWSHIGIAFKRIGIERETPQFASICETSEILLERE